MSDYSREAVRRALKRRRTKLGAAGLCIDCGKGPPETARTLCAICLTKRRVREKNRLIRSKPGAAQSEFYGPPEFCSICHDPITLATAQLDHCHVERVIRGWICRACNVGLGMFKDNPENLRSAIEYLQRIPVVAAVKPRISTVRKKISKIPLAVVRQDSVR